MLFTTSLFDLVINLPTVNLKISVTLSSTWSFLDLAVTVYTSTLFAAYGDDGQGPVRSVSPLTPETAESALSSRAHLPNRVSHTFWDLISNHLLDFDTPSGNSVKLRIQFELLVSMGLNHVNSWPVSVFVTIP